MSIKLIEIVVAAAEGKLGFRSAGDARMLVTGDSLTLFAVPGAPCSSMIGSFLYIRREVQVF